MVKYLVHFTVNFEVYGQFVEWLREEHVPTMLKEEGFLSAELCLRKGGSMESSSKELKVIYSVNSEESLRGYIAHRAMTLREEGLEKFPGRFGATREVWMDCEKISKP